MRTTWATWNRFRMKPRQSQLHWAARCVVLSRARSAATRAPCVLASGVPIALRWRSVILKRVLCRDPAGIVVVILLVLALVATALLPAACTKEDPPDKTLADLATQIGALKLDDMDFATILPAYTTEAYRANTQPEQADYQVFLVGKAADIALNKKDTATVAVTLGKSGGARTVAFKVGGAGGLFEVADISTITVTLVKAQGGPRPWLIEAVALAR